MGFPAFIFSFYLIFTKNGLSELDTLALIKGNLNEMIVSIDNLTRLDIKTRMNRYRANQFKNFEKDKIKAVNNIKGMLSMLKAINNKGSYYNVSWEEALQKTLNYIQSFVEQYEIRNSKILSLISGNRSLIMNNQGISN